jgi:hypothetical protein
MNRDDMEVVKAAAEGVTAGATRSLHDVVMNLLGGWSAEVGDEWRESAKRWRQRRAETIARRAVEMLERIDSRRRPVPPKILFRALDNASLEDDAELQERWAALIASAATADATEITADYVDILRALTPRDARLLEWVRDHPREPDPNDPSMLKDSENIQSRYPVRPRVGRKTVVEEFGLPDDEFDLVCSRLERLGLCDVGRWVFPTRLGSSATGPRNYDSIQLRPLGVALITACRSPGPGS